MVRSSRVLLAIALSLPSVIVASAAASAVTGGADAELPEVRVVKHAEAHYYEDTWAGGAHQLGKFRFVDHETEGLAGFQYSFDDPDHVRLQQVAQHDGRSKAIAWAPDEPGLHTLYVRSMGPPSDFREYRILVNYPVQKGRWDFHDEAGSATAADSSAGAANPLAVSASVEWVQGLEYNPADPEHPGAIAIDDPQDTVTAPSAVADTAGSFTVIAFVRLVSGSGTHIVVSQDGRKTARFNLGYVDGDDKCPSGTGGCWQFWIPKHDRGSASPKSFRARGTRPYDDVWLMVAGVYDAETYEGHPKPTLQVYTCDGGESGWLDPTGAPAVVRTSWSADGPLQVGHGMLARSPSNFWSGTIDQVRIYEGVRTESMLIENCAGSGRLG